MTAFYAGVIISQLGQAGTGRVLLSPLKEMLSQGHGYQPGLWLPDAGPARKLTGAIFPAGPVLSTIFHTDFSP